MKRSLAAFAVMCALALGSSAAVAGTSVTARARPATTAHASYCVYGRIGGVTKCLRAGEYCARRYRRQYLRYGFKCNERDDRGDWHLRSY